MRILRLRSDFHDYSVTDKDIKTVIFDVKIEITDSGKLLPTDDFDDMEAWQSLLNYLR